MGHGSPVGSEPGAERQQGGHKKQREGKERGVARPDEITDNPALDEALKSVAMATSILDDLKVNSARLVDVVIAFEDDFDIEIADDDVDTVNTVGDAVTLITGKLG